MQAIASFVISEYKVAKGETLFSISKKFHASIDKLVSHNP
ncbi:LysM peptidoglycan-binding domain-containing protein [Chryseolinea sp. Jin1]|uniref:LysM peptidoglycan-binding domain-containing protein n=1 Tax=Chryseolinea lacunae TaxID=2801331 RepID=A0ABS1KNY2_9BACT|nr:LysM peptidoglycan-binding domain-containing protein [Chryseolinea lacunae]